MDTSLISLAGQYGIVGLILLACGWFILYKEKIGTRSMNSIFDRHDTERKEWLIVIDRQHNECIAARSEATKALNDNTTALTRVCTLIEDRK